MKKKEIEKERDLLIAQLHDVQERLEELHIKSEEKDEKIAEIESINASLKDKLDSSVVELNGLNGSIKCVVDFIVDKLGSSANSCDVANDPLSGLKLLVEQKSSFEKNLAASESMRGQLLDQLHHVQEQFESLYLESKEQAETILDLEEKIRSKNRKLQKLSQKKREAVENLQQLEVELEERRIAAESDAALRSKRPRSINVLGRALLKRHQKMGLHFKEVTLIKSSSLFDEAWYLEENKDVAESDIDPALHYLLYGAEDRRDPSPHFSTEWYLSAYPDVAQEKINPLLHYLTAGKLEGRKLQAV